MKTLRFYLLCVIAITIIIVFLTIYMDGHTNSPDFLKYLHPQYKSEMLTKRPMEDQLPSVEKGYLIKTSGCKILNDDPELKEKMAVIKSQINPSKVKKFQKSIISYVHKSHIHLNMSELKIFASRKKIELSKISCCYRPVYRGLGSRSDLYIRVNKLCVPFSTSAIIQYEIVRIECSVNDSVIYKNSHVVVQIKQKVENYLKKKKRKFTLHDNHLSVLIIGIDGVSRENFHRFMKKSQKLLSNQSAIEFVGYNSVGENTYPNLIPLLTGLSSQSFQHAACRKKNKISLDGCPYIWDLFKLEGFRTAYIEDSADINVFTSRGGFIRPPTDYYFRPMYLLNKFGTYGKKTFPGWEFTEADQTLKLLSSLIETFESKKYFIFAWLNSLTHGNMLNAPSLDDLLSPFFSDLILKKVLNNTLLIFMSDHGPRYGKYRQTTYGWYESKLPLLHLMFPKWFFDKNSDLKFRLQAAAKQLTTAYDLHETLKDVLFHEKYRLYPGSHVDEYEEIVSAKGVPNRVTLYKNSKRRGISFFQQFPANRTCSDANIPETFCSCFAVNQISYFSDFIPSALDALVNKVNVRTKSSRNLCVEFVSNEILDARMMIPNDSSDNYNVLFSKEKQRSTLKYLLLFSTKPGNAVFEGIFELSSSNKPIVISVLRVNKIDSKSTRCVTKANLKLYCHCRKQKS